MMMGREIQHQHIEAVQLGCICRYCPSHTLSQLGASNCKTDDYDVSINNIAGRGETPQSSQSDVVSE